MEAGWLYLVAVLDWYSRYVVSWELDLTLELPFVLAATARALTQATPQIWNSDQGSHFTSPQYLALLQAADVAISMDGKGRALDNIFTERLWRTCAGRLGHPCSICRTVRPHPIDQQHSHVITGPPVHQGIGWHWRAVSRSHAWWCMTMLLMIVDQLLPYGGPEQAATVDDGSACHTVLCLCCLSDGRWCVQ